MRTYLPKKLNLEEHLNQYPPVYIEGFHIDNLKYILGLITEIPAKSEHFDSHDGFVPLNAETLKKRVWNYKQYLIYALATGILITDNQYIKGEKSKGYRFADKFMDRVESEPIVKYTLVKREQQEREVDPEVQKKYSYLVNFFDDDLEVDHTGAVEFLEGEYSSSDKSLDDIYRFNHNFSRLTKLKDREYCISVDGTVDRFHTNLTNLG